MQVGSGVRLSWGDPIERVCQAAGQFWRVSYDRSETLTTFQNCLIDQRSAEGISGSSSRRPNRSARLTPSGRASSHPRNNR